MGRVGYDWFLLHFHLHCIGGRSRVGYETLAFGRMKRWVFVCVGGVYYIGDSLDSVHMGS